MDLAIASFFLLRERGVGKFTVNYLLIYSSDVTALASCIFVSGTGKNSKMYELYAVSMGFDAC